MTDKITIVNNNLFHRKQIKLGLKLVDGCLLKKGILHVNHTITIS